MKPEFSFSKTLTVIDRQGNDQHATVLSITKTNGSFSYNILLEDGTIESIREDDLRVTN